MASSNGHRKTSIDKRDFDANRPLLHDPSGDGDGVHWRSGSVSRLSGDDGLDGRSDGLLSNVVEEIIERDRKKMRREVVRVSSFIWGVVSW